MFPPGICPGSAHCVSPEDTCRAAARQELKDYSSRPVSDSRSREGGRPNTHEQQLARLASKQDALCETQRAQQATLDEVLSLLRAQQTERRVSTDIPEVVAHITPEHEPSPERVHVTCTESALPGASAPGGDMTVRYNL